MLAESVASRHGLELVGVRFSQTGRKRTVEVTIYRRAGRISLDDCESVSREMEKELDEAVPAVLDGPYLLEVQSPGIDRQLSTEREFRVFAGQAVEVLTKEKMPPLGISFQGKLLGGSAESISLGNPQPLSGSTKTNKSKRQGKGQAAHPQEPIPETLEIPLSKLIFVKLYPDLSGAESAQPVTALL